MDQRWLSELEVTNLRNIAHVQLAPCQAINLLVGPNGSGKTTLLEAIHLISVGRSFLTAQAGAFIRHGTDAATVFGRLVIDGREARVGIKKDAQGGTEIRIDGSKGEGIASLAERLPTVLITPESHALVGGGPAERRALLDWGLFHVEHDYLELWRRYHRYLKQRNAALTAGGRLTEWTEGLAASGEAITQRRRDYLDALRPRFEEALGQLAPELGILTLDYMSGWPGGAELADALEQSEERDRRDGYTHPGPHRGELRLRLGGKRASEVLSRGQEKLVLSALRLAQLTHLRDAAGKGAVVLIDDLPAELDASHRRTFLKLLATLDVQVFVTATDRDVLELPTGSLMKMFHVEHGAVRTVL